MGNQLATAGHYLAPDPVTLESALDDSSLERILDHGRLYQSLLSVRPDGVQEVVKVFVVPEELDLLQVHLDDLVEVNQQVLQEADMAIGSHIDLCDRIVIVRRPYLQYTLEDLLTEGPGDNSLWMDGRRLAAWECQWVAHQLEVAVRLLHASGLFHGSLHPGNVLLDPALCLSLADLSPFKPHNLPQDDPTLFMQFYKEDQVKFIDPRRYEASCSSDIQSRQASDLFALEEMLQMFTTGAKPSYPTAIDKIVLPLVRRLSKNLDLELVRAHIEDLQILTKDCVEVSRIVCRFLVSQISNCLSQEGAMELLQLISLLVKDDISEDLKFYLEALKSCCNSVPIARACELILSKQEPSSLVKSSTRPHPTQNSPLSTTGQLLRYLEGVEVSPVLMEELKIIRTLLIFPEDRVRKAAIAQLYRVLDQLDEAERIALVHGALSPVLQTDAVIDFKDIPQELLIYGLKSPISKDLFELALRNVDQRQRLIQSVCAEDAKKIGLITSISSVLASECLDVIERKDLGITPIGLESGHEAFSPLLPAVDEADAEATYQIPFTISPSAYRHFQRRRLPFQFETYREIYASPDGDIFATQSKERIEVWRSLDFRRYLLPTPFFTVENTSESAACGLGLAHLCIWLDGVFKVYSIDRRKKLFELETAEIPLKTICLANASIILLQTSCIVYIRDQVIAWTCDSVPAHHGSLTDIVISDDDLFAVSTSTRGFISIWDLRYGLCLRSWRFPVKQISALSMVFEENASLDPPRLWLLLNDSDVIILDLSLASVSLSTDPNLSEQPLLEDDLEYHPADLSLNSSPIAHYRKADWILVAPMGVLSYCTLHGDRLDIVPLGSGFAKSSLHSIHLIKPTSAESSRNLSILELSLDGSVSILECLK